ncbi:hypothetical protein F5J12DRAFT_501612 [Pisolithus orientalis]|uniref:uncharacterized protein n=1 Tax=Pisolithus orientalis TaxID=936130 RepID=UPI0022242208|nr:uncharacterized protein F5J12DRAFT_501612 [Pisolithus orientalis]KAI5989811.1 hypothetical protein F5J12DRAFT_501612 [Pisolithus orientalis]
MQGGSFSSPMCFVFLSSFLTCISVPNAFRRTYPLLNETRALWTPGCHNDARIHQYHNRTSTSSNNHPDSGAQAHDVGHMLSEFILHVHTDSTPGCLHIMYCLREQVSHQRVLTRFLRRADPPLVLRESTQISYLRKNHKALVQRSASTHHPDFAREVQLGLHGAAPNQKAP